ncbi:unnamed protein product [Effrenium voratum]|uniref:Uncharacterized protein n=1 Tax=Effrenium voratum TaxID=2562239 RepID=A0AA36IT66_9DINO|nr:unnamed protein product [Effrenium voratum]
MGSGGSTLDVRKRIDELEKHCAGKKIGSGKDELDDILQCSKELVNIMDEVASASSPDLALIDRLGSLSEIIFCNLDSRICVQLLQLEDAADVRKTLAEIAQNIDKVRATPVADRLEAKWQETEKAQLVQHVKEIAEIVKGTSELTKLIEALVSINTKLEALPGAVPKDVAEKALAQCAGFSSAKLQKGFPGLLQKEGLPILEQLQAPAACFDAHGARLAACAEATWEPLAPQLVRLTAQVSSHMVKLQMQQAVAELAQDNFDAAIAALQTLQNWWPHSEGSDDRPGLQESIAKVFALAEERVLAAGDLPEVAGQLDAMGASLGLDPKLAEHLAARSVAAPLGCFEEELKKDDKNLQTLTSAAQELAAVAEKIPAEETDRVQSLLTSLEEHLLQKCQEVLKSPDLAQVLQAAQGYDEARPKMTPPLPEATALLPRVQEQVGMSSLQQAKEELAKDHGLNPAWVLECVKRVDLSVLPEEAATSLREISAKTCERMTESFREALAEGQEAKTKGLRSFAESFDTAVSKASESKGSDSFERDEIQRKLKEIEAEKTAAHAPEDEAPAEEETPAADEETPAADETPAAEEETPATEEETPAAEDETPAAEEETPAAEEEAPAAEEETPVAEDETPAAEDEVPSEAASKVAEMEQMLEQESGMNPNVILKNLTDLAALWPLPPLLGRLGAVLTKLQGRMASACASASAEDQEAKLKALLAFAHKVHELQQSMDSCAPQFLFAVCSAGADQDLKDAETELAKESGMNPMLVLKNIRNLKLYWQALGSDAESLHTRLGAMCDLMRSRITASYEQNEEKRPNLLKFSAAFDAAITGLEGAGEPNLAAKLSG